jgi:site-specific recombinase XerD
MVTIRAKKKANGTYHLYIDIYDNGQRKKEYLKLYVSEDYTQPETDKQGNILFDAKGQPKPKKVKPQDRELWALAESIRIKRELEIKTTEHGFAPKFRHKASFTEYFTKYVETYTKKDRRRAVACLHKFNEFNSHKNILCNAITEDYVISFKDFLNENFRGETPAGYFAHFKKAVKNAYKAELIKVSDYNKIVDVVIQRKAELKKDYLTFTEIQKMFSTPANNSDVKRAFLFSCLTGLRYCDIITLKWSEIKETESGLKIDKKQSKTQSKVNVNLNNDAVILLGKWGNDNDLVFNLPSSNGTNKSLKTWAKQAGIKKKVTYHVARHSFGTNLIFYGADAKTTSALLGHKNMNYTNLYINEVEALKEKSVNNLPNFELT